MGDCDIKKIVIPAMLVVALPYILPKQINENIWQTMPVPACTKYFRVEV